MERNTNKMSVCNKKKSIKLYQLKQRQKYYLPPPFSSRSLHSKLEPSTASTTYCFTFQSLI